MEIATASGGTRVTPEAPSLRQQVSDTALRLQHLAALALLCVGAQDREADQQGADHLLSGLIEMHPRLEALRRARGPV